MTNNPIQLSQAELAGVLDRADARAEFWSRHERGEHVLLLGPSGRGKTSWARSLLERPATSNAVILSAKGHDPSLAGLGKPAKSWPPPQKGMWELIKERWEEKELPFIRRWEPDFTSEESLARAARVMAASLRWLWSVRDWTMYLPDLQLVADRGMMGQGKTVEAHLLTARSRDTCLWLDAQAPRWIPRAACDQISHLFIFKNRDVDVVRRLREIAGLDMRTIVSLMNQMDYHELIWVDVKKDEYFLVEEQ